MGLGELICQEAIAHYKALQQKGKPSPNQWTVLSAIILERPSKSAETSQPEPDLTVITMATEPEPDPGPENLRYILGVSTPTNPVLNICKYTETDR